MEFLAKPWSHQAETEISTFTSSNEHSSVATTFTSGGVLCVSCFPETKTKLKPKLRPRIDLAAKLWGRWTPPVDL